MKLHSIFFTLIFLTSNSNAQKADSIIKSNGYLDRQDHKAFFKLTDAQVKNKQGHVRYAILTNYKEGEIPLNTLGNFGTVIDQENSSFRLYMINLSIVDMVNFSFGLPRNRIILNVKDKRKYKYSMSFGPIDDWMRQNLYCFECFMPLGLQQQTKTVNDELANLFKINFKVEPRMTEVAILVRTSKKDKISSGISIHSIQGKEAGFYDVPLSTIVQQLNNMEMPPIIDETGYTSNVNLTLDVEQGISGLISSLAKYDLGITLEKRQMQMLIINEN